MLEISLLGSFQVKVNGQPSAAFAYDKLRALLAYLSVESKTKHSREALATMLWPTQMSADAKRNLRLALFNVRRVLGDTDAGTPYLVATQKSLHLNPAAPYWLDVTKFAAPLPVAPAVPDTEYCRHCIAQGELQIALYRGPFLDGLSVSDTQDFEDWLYPRREALHRQALVLLERLAACHEQLGDYASALKHAERYALLEPWDEGGHRRLMQLLALNGGAGAALIHYEATRRLLERDLGVAPQERTRALADAIREGKFDAAPIIEPRLAPNTTSPAERRQVTVLYCELTITAADDPEKAMELLHAPQARCVEIIRQFAGHIVQTHGGGFLAYFGYPQAHEYAARRAVQAALALTREATRGVQIRVGIHTGLVIAGGELSMPDSSGGTSALAIQLRHGVAHDEVAISHETQRVVAGYFDCIDLGAQSLPGIEHPVEIFKVLRESGARTRLEAAAQLTPMVGRGAEIAELMGRWVESAHGAGHVVLVQGEAGMGKSRLLHALKERLTDQAHVVRELFCFPEYSQSPFHPLITTLEAIFGFQQGEAPEAKFAKLANYLEVHYPASHQAAVPLLGQLLSLPLTGHDRDTGLSPQKQREQTIAVLLELLQTLAKAQPMLLILEDVHWIDPSTLEFLTRFVKQTSRGATLTLLTSRPGFAPPWKETLHSMLVLAPLVETEVAQLIASISANVPAATVQRMVERADGVPLFAEEMAKIASLGQQARIPATLHDLLAARMDDMGEAKTTAQLAATLGREFDLDLLQQVFQRGPAVLERTLIALQDAGLVLKLNESSFQFKHALMQEAAYQSQTKSDRQATHQRAAQALQDNFPAIVEAQPERLAQHFSLSGNTRQAIEYWIKAGQRAREHSAHIEAMGHFNSALQLLMASPSEPDRDREELKIQTALFRLLHATKGFGSQEAKQASERISGLGEQMGDGGEFFMAKWALAMNAIGTAGSLETKGLKAAMQLLNMVDDDPLRQQAAHYAVANASFWLGEFESTRVHAEQAITLFHPSQIPSQLEKFGENLALSCAGYLSWALYFLGFPDQAHSVCQRMLEQSRQLAHPHTLSATLAISAVLYRWLRKPAEALSLSAEAIAISRQYDFFVWLHAGEMTSGWAHVMHGRKEGLAEIKSSIVGMRTSASGLPVVFLATSADASLYLKRPEEALDLLEQAQTDAQSTGDNHFTAELHRLAGECLLASSPLNAEQAEACFHQALHISRKQQAKSLELRAAMSMARLWQQQGKGADGRRLVGETYRWFSEGFDSHDLTEAKALLESLEQPKP